MDAVIMAGGKGLRMRSRVEKPLLTIQGKPMIEYVVKALQGSKLINDIFASVTKATPKTAELLSRLNIHVIEAPGRNYVTDQRYIIEKLGLEKVLTLSSDLPLISSRVIEKIVLYYMENYSPSLTVVVPSREYDKLGLSHRLGFHYKGLRIYPVGINIIDGKHIEREEIEEDVLIMDKVSSLINVNTLEDLKIAEAFLT